jgi:hypothetical protein
MPHQVSVFATAATSVRTVTLGKNPATGKVAQLWTVGKLGCRKRRESPVPVKAIPHPVANCNRDLAHSFPCCVTGFRARDTSDFPPSGLLERNVSFFPASGQ